MISIITKGIHNLRQSLLYYAKGLYTRFSEENLLFLAAGVAFNGILCLVPTLLLLTSLVGIFIHISVVPIQKIDDVLNTIFPSQPYAQQIKTSILAIIHEMERYRSAFGYAGIILLLWASASMFGSIRIVLNRIYHLRSRKFVIFTYLENLIYVIVLGGIFIAANLFSWILLTIESLIQRLPEFGEMDFSYFTQFISVLVAYLLAFLMFYFINRFLPGEKIPRKVAALAAFTTTTLWWIAGKAFEWYITAFHPYSKLYGTYTVVLVFILWIYYSSAVFIVGAIVGQLFRERHSVMHDRSVKW